MAISEFEEHRLESILKKFCDEKGPPAHIRDQLQWGFRIDPEQQTVELFEIRPYFMDASRKIESKFAKAAYVKTSKTWKVYWMRGTCKWTRYDPLPVPEPSRNQSYIRGRSEVGRAFSFVYRKRPFHFCSLIDELALTNTTC